MSTTVDLGARRIATAVWHGFDFRWDRTSHRLNVLGSTLDSLEVGQDHAVTGVNEARFAVGNVPDRGRAVTYLHRFDAPSLVCVDGEECTEIIGNVGELVEHRGRPIVVPLPVGAEGSSATVILRGFEVSCSSFAAGLHPQHLAVRVMNVERDARGLRFVPMVSLQASNSPDPLTQRRGIFAYEVRLLYTVLFGNPRDVHFTDSPSPSTHAHRRRDRGKESAPHQIVGQPNRFAQATVGLQGFEWSQRHRGSWGRDGRFLRRLQVAVEPGNYERSAGTLDVRPRLWFSNRGLVPYPIRSELSVWTTLLQSTTPGRCDASQLDLRVRTGKGDGSSARIDFLV